MTLTRRIVIAAAAAAIAKPRGAEAIWLRHGGSTPPPPSAIFIAPFDVKNVGAGVIANPRVSFFQPLAPADVPSSSSIQVRASNGITIIPSQQDQEPTWAQDGSYKGAAISFVSPDTFSAGQIITYGLWAIVGVPNRLPNCTLAQLAANSDIKLQFTGLDFGTDMFQVSVNDIISGGTNFPWGTNPMMGWEVIRAGPVCTEWRFWSYLRRVSDSAWHKWVKGYIFVRAWGLTGPFEIGGGWYQPNILGPSASGTVGATTEPRHVFLATLLDGATTLYSWGGASDFRVTTVAQNTINVSTSRFPLSANNVFLGGAAYGGSGVFGGVPVTVSSSGTLPAPLAANTVYWIGFDFGVSTSAFISATRPDSLRGGARVPITLTNAGTGNMTITPAAQCFPFQGQVAFDSTANRIWRGATRPTVLVAHDFTYLTTKSKALPPYIAGISVTPGISPIPTFSPGSQYFPPDPNGTGDSVSDDIVGFLTHHSAQGLYDPLDLGLHQLNCIIALTGHEQGFNAEDESKGTIVVVNDGPSGTGTSYTDMGTSFANLTSNPTLVPQSVDSPLTKSNVFTVSVATNDPNFAYTGWDLGNHMPCPFQVPYLKTGDLIYWEQGRNQANMVQLWNGPAVTTTVTRKYYNCVTILPLDGSGGGLGITRFQAWQTRAIGQAHHFMPASRVEYQYLHDMYGGMCNFPQDYVTNYATTQEKALGWYGNYQGGGAPANENSPFMTFMLFHCFAMEAWRNEFPDALTFVTGHFYKNVVGQGDWAGTPAGSVVSDGMYQSQVSASSPATASNLYTTWSALFAATVSAGFLSNNWQSPNDAPGGHFLNLQHPAGLDPNSPGSYCCIWTSAIGMADVLGVPHAKAVYDEIRFRQQLDATTIATFLPATALDFTNYPKYAIGYIGAIR